MPSPASPPKSYTSLTTTIESHLPSSSSPLLSFREAIHDILAQFSDPPHNHSHVNYLALILSIKTHQLAILSILDFDSEGLHMKTEMAEGGRGGLYRFGSKYIAKVDRQMEEYVVLISEEGENEAEAGERFVEGVERIGGKMGAVLEATDVEVRAGPFDEEDEGSEMKGVVD